MSNSRWQTPSSDSNLLVIQILICQTRASASGYSALFQQELINYDPFFTRKSFANKMSDLPLTPQGFFLLLFRMIRLIVGLIIIGWGCWLFIQQFIDKPDQGGSVLLSLVLILVGVLLAISAKTTRKPGEKTPYFKYRE